MYHTGPRFYILVYNHARKRDISENFRPGNVFSRVQFLIYVSENIFSE